MAYVILVAEGEAAAVLRRAAEAAKGRLRPHTQTDGAIVVYDTNLAREFVRDVKAAVTGGKLVVFRCDDPHEVFEPGGRP